MMGRRLADTRAVRTGTGQRREKGISKKTDTAKNRVVMTGWNLPFIPDENDIVAWMKREKNGDNKKKPRRDEEVPEEAFRHMFSRCCSLENQMDFERESLVQRYRKHCQFGPEKTRRQSVEKPAAVEIQEKVPSTPSGGLRFPRSCKSAEVPGTPKVSTLQQIGLGDDDLESLIPTRSHSVIDDSKLRAYGLTLPPDEKTARLLELAGKFIARAESAAKAEVAPQTKPPQNGARVSTAVTREELDEGYDSKISSNGADGADEDEDGSRVVQLDTTSEKTNLDSEPRESELGGESVDAGESTTGWTNSSRVMPGPTHTPHRGVTKLDLARPQPQAMTQYQAPTDSGRATIAKLMYSQRDRNLYERTPNRRMRHNGFRYAGKEQSRLMETSLNYITPGYLSLHQFANLSNFVQYPPVLQEQQNHQQQPQEQQYQQLHASEGTHQQQQDQPTNTCHSSNSTPTRTIAMRRICIQDLNNLENNNFSLEAKDRLSESPTDIPNQETIPDLREVTTNISANRNGAQSEITDKPEGASNFTQANSINQNSAHEDHQSITGKFVNSGVSQPRSQDETSTFSSRPRQSSGTGGRDNLGCAPRHYNDPDSVVQGSQRRTSQTTLPGFRSKNIGSGLRSERLSTTCFPVADLLPAVEKSLRRKGRRGLSRHHQQLLYRSQTTLLDGSIWKQAEQPVTASYPDSLNYSSSLGASGLDVAADEEVMHSPRLQFQPGESILRTAGGVSLLVHHKTHGPPGFRPHNSLSPLQRAKDIVNRRLHGHITHLPDGSETVQVTSPQYQSSRMDRISSASRRLGRIIDGTWKHGS